MPRILVALLALLTALAIVPARASDLPPDVLARTTTQEVLTILRQDRDIQAGNVNKLYQLVETKILPNFDFNRMTQLAVGRHWASASAQQKQALVTEFRNLLVRTYATSLTAFANQSIEFRPLNMRPGDEDVVVRSEIRQPGGQPLAVDYRMYKTPFGWKVYDVSIDGVSLVTNYRASFNTAVRQGGIDGLIRTLSQQSERAAAQGRAGS